MNYNILSSSRSNKFYQHNIVFCYTTDNIYRIVSIILLNTQKENYTSTTFTNYLTSDFTYMHGIVKNENNIIFILSNMSKGTNNQIYVRYLSNAQTTETVYSSFPPNNTTYKDTFKDNVVQIL